MVSISTHYDRQDEHAIINSLLGKLPFADTYKWREGAYTGIVHSLPASSWDAQEKIFVFSDGLIKIIGMLAESFLETLSNINSTWTYAPKPAIQEGRMNMLTTEIEQTVINKFSTIEQVESIYGHKKNGLYKFYVFVKTQKYDDTLMQELFGVEIEIEDMFLSYKFKFHYVPIMLNKANVVSLDYQCFYAR